MKVERACEICGSTFWVYASVVRKGNGKTCSRTCKARKAAQAAQLNRTRAPSGYICVGTKRLHRLVVEAVLGRSLLPSEVVHHVNGDKHDNRPANLQVLSQAEHARIHGLFSARNLRPACLTRVQASEIRRKSAYGQTGRSLAREFDVSPMTISRVINGRSYTEERQAA